MRREPRHRRLFSEDLLQPFGPGILHGRLQQQAANLSEVLPAIPRLRGLVDMTESALQAIADRWPQLQSVRFTLPVLLRELFTDTSGARIRQPCAWHALKLSGEVGTTHVGPWETLKEVCWHATYDGDQCYYSQGSHTPVGDRRKISRMKTAAPPALRNRQMEGCGTP